MPSVIEKEEIVKTLSPGQLKKIAQGGHPIIDSWMAVSELKLRTDTQERKEGQKAAREASGETLVDKYAGVTGIPGAKGKRIGGNRPGAGGIRSLQQPGARPQPGPRQPQRPQPQRPQPQGMPQASPLMASMGPASPRPGAEGPPLQFNEGREVRPPKKGVPALGREVPTNPDYVRRVRELEDKRRREDELMEYRSYLKKSLDPSLRGLERFNEGGGVSGGTIPEGWTEVPEEIWEWVKENPTDAAMLASTGLMFIPGVGWGIAGAGAGLAKIVSWAPKAMGLLKSSGGARVALGRALEKVPGLGSNLKKMYQGSNKLPTGSPVGRPAMLASPSGGAMGVAKSMIARERQKRIGGMAGVAGGLAGASYGVGALWPDGSDPEMDEAPTAVGTQVPDDPQKANYDPFTRLQNQYSRDIPSPMFNIGSALTAGGGAALSSDPDKWAGNAVTAFNDTLGKRRAQSQVQRLEGMKVIPQRENITWMDFLSKAYTPGMGEAEIGELRSVYDNAMGTGSGTTGQRRANFSSDSSGRIR